MPWVQMGGWWQYRNRKNLTLDLIDAIRAQVPLASARMAPMRTTRPTRRLVRLGLRCCRPYDITGDRGRVRSRFPGFSTTAVGPLSSPTPTTTTRGARWRSSARTSRTRFFPHVRPLWGTTIHVGAAPSTVIGTLSRQGSSSTGSRNLDLEVIGPAARLSKGTSESWRSIAIGVAVRVPVDKMRRGLKISSIGVLRRARKTPPDKPDDFAINRPEQTGKIHHKQPHR